jgi:hypothetical protein
VKRTGIDSRPLTTVLLTLFELRRLCERLVEWKHQVEPVDAQPIA